MALTKATYSMVDGALARVTDFGVVGDGVADDTAALQAAINYAVANQLTLTTGGNLTINITSTITIPPSLNADFAGAIISPNASMTSGYAVVVDGVTGALAQRGNINNFYLAKTLVSNHADTSSNLDGIAFGGASGRSSDMLWTNLVVVGFRDGVCFVGPHSYLNHFVAPKIGIHWRRGVAIYASSDSNENYSFFGGSIFNVNNPSFNGTGFYVDAASSISDTHFYGTSFDYCDISVNMYQGVAHFSGCHFENNNNNPHVALVRTGGKLAPIVTFTDGSIGSGPGVTSWTGIPVEDANGRPAWITTTGGSCQISLLNTLVGKYRTTETVTEIVKLTDGISNRKLSLSPSIDAGFFGTVSSPDTISYDINKIYVGASGSLTGWTNPGASGVTWSADTSEAYAPDTGSRKIVGTSGASASLSQIAPLGTASAVVVKSWIKVTSISTGYAGLRVKFLAPDQTTVIQDSVMAQAVSTATSVWTPQYGYIPVPKGAAYIQFNDYASSFTGTAYFSNEYLWLI